MPYVSRIRGYVNYKPMFVYCYQTWEDVISKKQAENCRVEKDRKINSSCETCKHCEDFYYSHSEIVCDVIIEASEIAEKYLKDNTEEIEGTIDFFKESDKKEEEAEIKKRTQKNPEQIKKELEAQKRIDERAEAYNQYYKELQRQLDGFNDL